MEPPSVDARPAPSWAVWVLGGFPNYGENAPLDLDVSGPQVARQFLDLIKSGGFDDFADTLARVGNCARPIRLRGGSERVDTVTGEVLSSYSSAVEPFGVTYVRCGNRRASECPSCSRLYARDVFEMIRAGVSGGKTVPASVADNPLVFATVTAPSFGRVHRHTGGACRPAAPGMCQHGRSMVCRIHHGESDELVGQPLCPDCYDYESQVVWQWWSTQLWRRFTIVLRRLLAKRLGVPERRLREIATIQYAKIAEYQSRGAIHFHALVRLDGRRCAEGFAPAPETVDARQLARLVRSAAQSAWLIAPPVDGDDVGRRIVFGAQLDARPVSATGRTDDPDQRLLPEQVAGYLAKYATKSATDSGPGQTSHGRRLEATARRLAARGGFDSVATGGVSPYRLLRKWADALGFRGHFASRSQRYSITLGALRRARRRAQALIAQANAQGRVLDLAAMEADLLADDDAEATVVIGHWTYDGCGWANDAEHALAVAAAARAREYEQWRADQRRSGQLVH